MQRSTPSRVGHVVTLASFVVVSVSISSVARADIDNVADLVAAVTGGAPGDVVVLAAGTFELTEPLRPQAGMEIRGAGVGVTILRNAASWAPGNTGLDQDEGAQAGGVDCSKYLFDLGDGNSGLVFSDMTLTGPSLHGGICGFFGSDIELKRLEFTTFLWAGVRAFGMSGASIHDNTFFDAGGKSMGDSGSSGGALFLTYTSAAEIYDNRFDRSDGVDGYGIKGREARQVHIHHNTIDTDFAIELPFENDYDVEIDHNYLGGTISVPKYGGGTFPEGGYTFHVHHNYFKSSYSFEYQRNAVEIDHNLFDFAIEADYGNLISGFDTVAAVGGTTMHDNLIRNPGRGIYWNEGVYDDFAFYNNHIRGETTVTPRTEGLFDFRPERDGAVTDWTTIVLRDNIIELTGTERPLMRTAESYAAVLENNQLSGINDTAMYTNADTGRPRGPLEPLCFGLGAYEEFTIDGWEITNTPEPAPPGACGEGGTDSGSADGGTGDAETGEAQTGDVDSTNTAVSDDGPASSPTSDPSSGGAGGGDTVGGAGADEPGQANGCGCAAQHGGTAGGALAILILLLGLPSRATRGLARSCPRLRR